MQLRNSILILTCVLTGCTSTFVRPLDDGSGAIVVHRTSFGKGIDRVKEAAGEHPILTGLGTVAVGYFGYRTGEHYGWWDEMFDDGEEDSGKRSNPNPSIPQGTSQEDPVNIYIQGNGNTTKVEYKRVSN